MTTKSRTEEFGTDEAYGPMGLAVSCLLAMFAVLALVVIAVPLWHALLDRLAPYLVTP